MKRYNNLLPYHLLIVLKCQLLLTFFFNLASIQSHLTTAWQAKIHPGKTTLAWRCSNGQRFHSVTQPSKFCSRLHKAVIWRCHFVWDKYIFFKLENKVTLSIFMYAYMYCDDEILKRDNAGDTTININGPLWYVRTTKALTLGLFVVVLVNLHYRGFSPLTWMWILGLRSLLFPPLFKTKNVCTILIYSSRLRFHAMHSHNAFKIG